MGLSLWPQNTGLVANQVGVVATAAGGALGSFFTNHRCSSFDSFCGCDFCHLDAREDHFFFRVGTIAAQGHVVHPVFQRFITFFDQHLVCRFCKDRVVGGDVDGFGLGVNCDDGGGDAFKSNTGE